MTENNTFDATVFGSPEPAGSKRAVTWRARDGRSGTNIVDANPRAAKWKEHVAQEAGRLMKDRPLLRGPLEVSFTFYRARPKGHYNKRGELLPSAPVHLVTKPDCLKYARGVEDALTGVVYSDDSQIVLEVLKKEYGEPERVEITITELAQPKTATPRRSSAEQVAFV